MSDKLQKIFLAKFQQIRVDSNSHYVNPRKNLMTSTATEQTQQQKGELIH